MIGRRMFLKLLGIAPISTPMAIVSAEVAEQIETEQVIHDLILPQKGDCFIRIGDEVLLLDYWPEGPTQGPYPEDWTCVEDEESFPFGTKRLIYDDTSQGWCTVIYLQYSGKKGRRVCCFKNAHCVTDVRDAKQLRLPIAIHLGSKVVSSTCAWFWCGGVCPVEHIPGTIIKEITLQMKMLK